MAFYLPPQALPVFDPPAIVMQAEAALLSGPLAALIERYQPPKASTAFVQEAADYKPAVKNAVMQQLLLSGGPISSTYVNSIQQVSITLSAATSNTGTCPVVSANAFPIFQGFSATGASTDAATSSPRITYSIAAGTMTITATLNSSGSCVVNVSVVDPKVALVTAVTSGTITITAGTSNTATGLTLSTTLSAVFHLGQTSIFSSNLGVGSKSSTSLSITSSSVITATLNNSGTVTVAYVAVTFAAGALQSNVQQFSVTKAAGTSNTQTITSVVAANSIVAWGGSQNTAANAFVGFPLVNLTGPTTLTFTTNSTATFICTVTVIEFVPGVLKSSQYGTVAIAASTSGTATPGTAVTTSNTICAWLGNTGAGTTDATTNTRITLTNGTPTITANVTTSSSPSAGFGLYEFN